MGAGPGDGGDLLAGRYEVGPLVGRGGTAQVHRAWDREAGRAVAVKVFRTGSTSTSADGGAREVRVLRGVSHPNVVGVHDCGVDGAGRPFVVMDYVDGQSLAGRLQRGPLPVADVVTLGAVLADALADVHARGIVHRDVKPANVLLDAAGRPWLADFGIARIVDATRMTATGLVIGTAAYMAPEQVRGESVGPPADVYALGLVLLEAATGRREYEGNTLESALARLHRAPTVPRDLPEPLVVTVRRMTALNPGVRPTAADVAAVLREPRVLSVRPRSAVRRAAPFAALTCLVAAALAGLVPLTGARSAETPAAGSVAVPAAVPPASAAGADASPDAPAPVPVALTHPRDAAADARPPAAATGPSGSDASADARGGGPSRGDRSGDAGARGAGGDRPSGARRDEEGGRDKGDKADKGDKSDEADEGDKAEGKADEGTGDKGDKADKGEGGDRGRSGSHAHKG